MLKKCQITFSTSWQFFLILSNNLAGVEKRRSYIFLVQRHPLENIQLFINYINIEHILFTKLQHPEI